jgi:hypothetical protein
VGGTGSGVGGVSRPSEPAFRHIERLAATARTSARPIVFDTQAVIDFIEQRLPTVELLDPVVMDPACPVVISVVTLSEVLVLPAKSGDLGRVDALRRAVVSLPGLTLVGIDEQGARETALVRAATGLRLPDAAVVAAARLVDAVALIGNDRRWRPKPLGVPYEHLDDIVALAEAGDPPS